MVKNRQNKEKPEKNVGFLHVCEYCAPLFPGQTGTASEGNLNLLMVPDQWNPWTSITLKKN